MSDFTTVYNDTVTLSGRPDLPAEVILAIREATLNIHTAEMWPRDVQEATVNFPSALNIQQFNISDLTRYRQFSYIRFWDPTGIDPTTGLATGAAGQFFTPIPPDKIFEKGTPAQDYGAIAKDYTYYIAGTVVNLQSKAQTVPALLIGYYQQPVVGPIIINPDGSFTATFTSWIVDDYPLIVPIAAAQIICDDTGAGDSAKNLAKRFAIQWTALSANNIDMQGR